MLWFELQFFVLIEVFLSFFQRRKAEYFPANFFYKKKKNNREIKQRNMKRENQRVSEIFVTKRNKIVEQQENQRSMRRKNLGEKHFKFNFSFFVLDFQFE